MSLIPSSTGQRHLVNVSWSMSLSQSGIERERGLAKDPILIRRLGEGKRLARGAQDFRERADRIRKIRTPGNPRGAERNDDLAEKRFRRAFAPALGRHIDRRDLQIDLLVFGQIEELGGTRVGWPSLERRARQVVEDHRDLRKTVHDLA